MCVCVYILPLPPHSWSPASSRDKRSKVISYRRKYVCLLNMWSLTFYFDIVSDSQKITKKKSTERSHVPFIQLPPVVILHNSHIQNLNQEIDIDTIYRPHSDFISFYWHQCMRGGMCPSEQFYPNVYIHVTITNVYFKILSCKVSVLSNYAK